MSELFNNDGSDNCRWKFLATASVLALTVSLPSSVEASDDVQRPSVWIELGGQLERISGGQDAFLPPFMTISPIPGPYSPISPAEAQKPSIYSYGAEGKLSFRPRNGDWSFSVGIKYGRSNSKKHLHQQTAAQSTAHFPPGFLTTGTQLVVKVPQFADYQTQNNESHAILDFSVGRDIGIGVFGRDGSSTVHAGIRFADFASNSTSRIIARPKVDFREVTVIGFQIPTGAHSDYFATATNSRSFHGVGPKLSWDASANLLGNAENGVLTADWGLNAGVLFGRQKANGQHAVSARYYGRPKYDGSYTLLYHHATPHARSKSVVVPNMGGFAGLSIQYPSAKISFGYRADLFFGAMDVGLDARRDADRNFYGPFATISIGLGG